MSFIVKEDETLDPVDVGFLGAVTVVFKPERAPYLVEQFWRLAHADPPFLAAKYHWNR
jgi:hypothetical protein